MNLDSTQIAIRERNFAEIMDLALQVIRAHTGPLLLAAIVGIVPWAALNGLILGGMLSDTLWDNPSGYCILMLLFVAIETPLATAPITLYLGQVTFSGAGDPGRIARDYLRSLPQMLLMQGLVRAVAALPVITLLLPYVSWPYLSELILLERNALLAGKGTSSNGKGGVVKRLTTRKRSKNLHKQSGGDLFTRWIASASLGAMLVGVGVGGVHTFVEQFFGYRLTAEQNLLFTFPAMLWLATAYFAVVRFLAYLDLRIRREGWEVELTMRAEAARLARLA